ncbi:TauD/TfdA family dioxygenase [Streptomyces avermitilis]|uniref:TauD/TfdA family dioxygenase n=1 Tax=Streptomyces avermitilis TaxID=33903 RepID=UPI0033A089D4
MRGTFRQEPGQPHVALRRELLDSGRMYEAPLAPLPGRADAPGAVARAVLDGHLRPHGVGVVDLDRAMSNAEFRAFGEVLGDAQPERSPDVAPMVEDGVVLDLVTRWAAVDDPARQPFAANSLSLHSESSGAPMAAQPRYIVLMCLAPGGDGRAAQTVVVSMADVHDALRAPTRQLLTGLRYDRPGAPPVLRHVDGRPVFSLRDFLDAPMTWTHDAYDGDPSDVRHALAELYATLYSRRTQGFCWQPGRLVVIDNTRHFHGRTAGADPVPGRVRRLKRLRLAARGACR